MLKETLFEKKFFNKLKVMRKIIASLFVLGLGFSALAQDASSGPEFRKHRFGLKVTPGASWFKVNKIGSENKSIGYHVAGGLNYEYSLNKNVAITSGLLFTQTTGGIEYTDSVGLKYAIVDNGVSTAAEAYQLYSRRYIINSIDVPLTFKFRTAEIGYLTYYGEFGGMANIVTNAFASKNVVKLNETDGATTELSGNESRLEAKNEVNFLRVGVNFGAGVEWNLVGNTSLLIGVNGNLALNNLMQKSSDSIFYRTTNASFQRATRLNYCALQIGVQF